MVFDGKRLHKRRVPPSESPACTGRRAGQVANTTFFCEATEGVLQAINQTELAKGGRAEGVEARDGIPTEEAWANLPAGPSAP